MESNEEFHETIAKLCYKHFETLPKTGKPTQQEWTILSCIVKEEKHLPLEVISLGTGSKCIGKNSLSPHGDILNDSHAEIICRRAFLRYLYQELTFAIDERKSSIFYKPRTKSFALRDGIRFHFFTTHVPCGDAAIFLMEDDKKEGETSEEDFGCCLKPDSNKRKLEIDEDCKGTKIPKLEADIYRTGAKCLENAPEKDLHLKGPEYHITGAVRTKPGRGDPTLSVSCSDKILKWTYLGVQGALLNVFIEKPIYLTTFTIAGNTLYSQSALERALCRRCESDVQLDEPFRRQSLIVKQAKESFMFAKDISKQPCPSSVIWCKTESKALEVAVNGRKQGVTKKNFKTPAGLLQISKKQLFNNFLTIAEKTKFHEFISSSSTYKECKNCARSYQANWEKLKNDIIKIWTVKSDDLLNFTSS